MKRLLSLLLAVLVLCSCCVTAGAGEAGEPGGSGPIKVVFWGDNSTTSYFSSITEAITGIKEQSNMAIIHIISDTNLTGDIELPETASILVDKNVTVTSSANISMSGFNSYLTVYGTLKITGGTIISSCTGGISVSYDPDFGTGKLTIKGGTIKGNGCAIMASKECEVELSGGMFITSGEFNGYNSAIDFSNISHADWLAPGYAFVDKDGKFIDSEDVSTATELSVAHKHEFVETSEGAECNCGEKLTVSQPEGEYITAPGGDFLRVEASEDLTDLAWQWKKDGEVIEGSTGDSLRVGDDLGEFVYTCEVLQGGAVAYSKEFNVVVKQSVLLTDAANITIRTDELINESGIDYTVDLKNSGKSFTLKAMVPGNLREGVDYEIFGEGTFSKPGKYLVGIRGIGNYFGESCRTVYVKGTYPAEKPSGKVIEVSAWVEPTLDAGVPTPPGGSNSVGEFLGSEIDKTFADSNGQEEIAREYYDITLKNADGSSVSKDDFPKDGITVVLPFPAGVKPNVKYDYVIVHLPKYDGRYHSDEVEILSGDKIEVTEKGLKCTFKSFCPVAIGYKTHVHVWGTDWKPDGRHHWRECTICGEKKDEANHTLEQKKDSANHWQECSLCGYKTTRVKHSYSGDWVRDDNNHWKECSCGEKSLTAEHTEGTGIVTTEPTESKEGVKTFRCTICLKELRTESVPKLKPGGHDHSYGTEWKFDKSNHWHECSVCGVKNDTADHTSGDWIVDKAPTATQEGSRHKECRVCGYHTESEVIPAGGGTEPTPTPKPDRPNGGGGGGYYPPSYPSGPSATSTPSETYYPVKVEKPENGKVTVSHEKMKEGGTVTVKAEPDEGFMTGKVTVSGGDGREIEVKEKDGGFEFVMPDGPVTVKAEFEPLPTVPWKNPFPDVKQGAWYYEAIEAVCQKGLMEGYSSGLFGPDDRVSRAQFAQVLYNMAGRPEVEAAGRFSDVKPGSWYAPAVCWAAEKGIASGYSDGRFGPGDPITRQDLCSMLWRYAGSPKASGGLDCSDAGEVSAYALDALRWAVERGVLKGKPGNLLDPKGFATRAEAARMISSYLSE